MWVWVYQANRTISPFSTTETVGGQTIEIYDGQYFLQDESDATIYWTWERSIGYWERPVLYNTSDAKIKNISVIPGGGGSGGEVHEVIRLDYFNCHEYSSYCIPSTFGSFYSLRQNINVYSASGTFIEQISSSSYDIVFDAGYGYTLTSNISSVVNGTGIRVRGKRNKSTGIITDYAQAAYAADNFRSHPSNYIVDTY